MLQAVLTKLLSPALDCLTLDTYKEKIISTWLEAALQGKWDEKGIEHCGLSVNLRPDCPENLLSHTFHVTQACAALYDAREGLFETIGPSSREDLIAGAILHDVGKLLELDYADGAVCYSPSAKYFRHPISGAYYAKKNGFPDHIVHMVLTHSNTFSPEGARAFQTPESLILRHVDEMCYQYTALCWRK